MRRANVLSMVKKRQFHSLPDEIKFFFYFHHSDIIASFSNTVRKVICVHCLDTSNTSVSMLPFVGKKVICQDVTARQMKERCMSLSLMIF